MKLIKTKIILQCLVVFFLITIISSCYNKKQNDLSQKPSTIHFDNRNEFAYLNKIRDLNYLVSLLDNSSELESERIGIEGRQSQSYPLFQRFSAIASDTALVRLTKHSNPKIRVYSMWALTSKNKQLALNQLKLMKNDKADVIYRSGCTSIAEKVNWLIASKFDSSAVVLKPKKNSKYIDFDIIIK